MKCPVCNISLVMSERSGVEIDYCPECRGVWLDRGELDKIIEKSSIATPARSTDNYREAPRVSYNSHSDHDKDHYDERSVMRKKKKENFLADLFDFGD